MGVSGKPKVHGGLGIDGKKWVGAVISVRAALKPIHTKDPVEKEKDKESTDDDQGDESCSMTPTGEEAKIPTIMACPPAPKKPKPSLNCSYGSVKAFFTPPDLESAFVCHVERSKLINY